MSRKAKIGYFFVALFTMACLGGASVSMAVGMAWVATVLFAVAFVVIGIGFVVRKRLLRASKVQY